MLPAEKVRAFNRFYTREIRLLDSHLPDSDLPLPDARVLYEIAKDQDQTAAEIGRRLDMDKAHLSRVLSRLRMKGLVLNSPSPLHAKHKLLRLTKLGHAAYAEMDQGSQRQVEAMLQPLPACVQARLVTAMADIQSLLQVDKAPPPVTLRSLKPGDLGWITHRQAVLYHHEYGWDWRYEGLVADILGKFTANFDPQREDAWVAEQNGQIVGSVFLMQGDEAGTAKLRLLYVEPHSRGAGVGRLLVETCIARARALGYDRLTLWTNSVLTAARRIYESAGFALTAESEHNSFGKVLTGQTWILLLGGPPEFGAMSEITIRRVGQGDLREDIPRAFGISLPNPAQVELHESFGFQLVGTYPEVGRKFGRFWDAATDFKLFSGAAGGT